MCIRDRYVDYEKMYYSRFRILRLAFERWKNQGSLSKELLSLETEEYCFYMAVKNHFQGKCWSEWDEDIRNRKPGAVVRYERCV